MNEWRVFFRNAREQAKYGIYGDANIATKNLKEFRAYIENVRDSSDGIWDQAKCTALIDQINGVISEIAVYGLHSQKVKDFFGLNNAHDVSADEGPVLTVQDPPKTYDAKDAESGAGAEVNPTKPAIKEAAPVNDAPMDKRPSASSQTERARQKSLQPQSLDEFIGQTKVVERLKEAIEAAEKRGDNYIGNTLLLGNRGLGKSTLMRLIAKELGVECHIIDASAVNADKLQAFLLNIAKKQIPCVIGIDEIHALKESSQTMLLTLLNDRIFRYVDKKGESYEIPMTFTFIGATTDPNKVLQTIKDRCANLTFYLTDYTHDELKAIFVNKFAAYGLQVPDDIIEACIARCRSSIREVEAFAKGLSDKAVVAGLTAVPCAMAEEYFSQRSLDEKGLTDKDREILTVLYTDENGGFISADTLAARVHLSPGVLSSEYEPYLLKIGFIGITSRGRYLTEDGKKYISAKSKE